MRGIAGASARRWAQRLLVTGIVGAAALPSTAAASLPAVASGPRPRIVWS